MKLDKYKREGKKEFELIEDESFRHGLNIHVAPELFSFDDVVIEGECDYEENILLQQFFDSRWQKNHSKVDYFNQGYVNKFTFVHVTKETKDPVHIVVEQDENFVHYIFVLVDEGVSQNVFVTNKGNPDYAGQEIRVIAQENSKLEMYTFQDFGGKTTFFDKRTLVQQKASLVNSVDIALGSRFSRIDSRGFLEGREASLHHHVLYFRKEAQKIDVSSNAHHIAAQTQSDLVTRGALTNNAHGLARSLIYIGKDAHDSQGYETQDALVLEEGVKIDAIPKLEIKNPDVKCSHGSTVGQVNKEDIFYLMSRGISKKAAERIIVLGYFESLVSQIKQKELQETIMSSIEHKLG